MLFDPAILILDEATSSVDAESERAICAAVRRWAGRRTTIVIAHRLSTLQDADRLFVFDQGRLVEQGSPGELIQRQGLYQKLAQLQGSGGGPRRKEEGGPGSPRPGWMEPITSAIEDEGDGLLCVTADGCLWPDAFAAKAFPLTHKEGYISLLQREPSGRECELGMISSLATWSQSARAAVQRSLGRRYLLQAVDEIRQIRNAGNQIVLVVLHNGVRAEIEVDNRGDTSCPFGDNGLLLIDVQGCYYVIADRDRLPKQQRKLLELYFGN